MGVNFMNQSRKQRKADKMNEVWKAVKGYEGLYEISNTGKVKSLIKERLLKPWEHKKGYLGEQE